MVAVVVTSLIRARLPFRAWKAVHWLAYGAWPLAMLHGLTAGTDSGAAWARAVYVLAGLSVAAAVAWRLAPRTRPGPGTAPVLVRVPQAMAPAPVRVGAGGAR